MSTYLANLVQRSASTSTSTSTRRVVEPAVHTELPWHHATLSVPDVEVPAVSSEEAATADTRTEINKPRSASLPYSASEPHKHSHKTHSAASDSSLATTAHTATEIRPAVSTSIHSQLPTQTTDQASQVKPASVSLSSGQPSVPVNLSTDNKPDAHDKDVANVQPRTASPALPGVIVQPSSETSTNRLTAALSTNVFQPPGRSVEVSKQTDTPVMARTATLEAPAHAEAKSLAEAKPVQVPAHIISQQAKTRLPQTIVPAPATALRLPPAERAYRPGKKAGESPHDVQVRIGRVEVRAAPDQQIPLVAAPAHTSTRGFDDYISMRTYTRNSY